MSDLTCFKAYDIRGQLGTELNEDIAYRIGRAFAEFLKPKNVVLGGDVRLTSEELKQALANGIRDTGADVIDGTAGADIIHWVLVLMMLNMITQVLLVQLVTQQELLMMLLLTSYQVLMNLKSLLIIHLLTQV